MSHTLKIKIITFLFAALALHKYVPALTIWLQTLGSGAFIGFFILYCLSSLLFIPIEPLALAAGSLFGFYYGFLICLLSAVISASIAFMMSRYLGFPSFLGSQNKLLIKQQKIFSNLGWKSLAVSRLTPFLPCSIVNYGYGLTNITLLSYTITNLIFFIPYKLIIAYTGAHL